MQKQYLVKSKNVTTEVKYSYYNNIKRLNKICLLREENWSIDSEKRKILVKRFENACAELSEQIDELKQADYPISTEHKEQLLLSLSILIDLRNTLNM